MDYQPIENYGIIGDLNTVALVGLNGSIDFMCFPDFDSPTIFSSLLDKNKGGYFQIVPVFGEMRNKQLYLPETNVLLTRFLSSEGVGELTDFMPADDGLIHGEGMFSMCSFWYIECLAKAGNIQKARLYFEKMIGYANHLGLYSEQLGFQGEHLGNFPQAFTHLGLISAAISLDRQLDNLRNKEHNHL